MKFLDLLRISSSSLFKRKVRTILTVLGVVIGTASIVVMISLGLGLNRSQMKMIEENGGLTTITVFPTDGGNNFYGGGMMMTATADVGADKETEKKRLDDKAVELIKALEHVNIVSPQLEFYTIAKTGMYEGNVNVVGLSVEALESMQIPLAQGTLPIEGDPVLKLVYGNQVLRDFRNAKTQEGFWATGVMPEIDFMNDPVFYIFDTDAYYQSQNPQQDGPKVAPPKKLLVEGAGIVAGTMEDWGTHAYRVYCDIEALKPQLKKIFRNRVIPGQPTTSSGKPYKEIYYNSLYVSVDDMNNMKIVQEAITNLGYQANSNMEWIESQQKQFASIQAVLGGIGAVSLLVAAIGITNTMMMSIYERTKEIGIMKVLGCDLRNIQVLFLMEAAYIGLLGGAVGLLLSYGLSAVINKVTAATMAMEGGISFIPPWLSLVAVVFAVLVGMVAGFFPSMRAMKLSPLAAIRNE